MKKYILIEVCDRDINTPEFFGTKEAAQAEMRNRLIHVADDEDIKKRINSDSVIDDEYDYGIDEDSAWINNDACISHSEYDWKISGVDV